MAISKAVLSQSTVYAQRIARLHALSDEERFFRLKRGAELRMAEVDALPLEWRLLVYEYGLTTVRQMMRERKADAGKAAVKLILSHIDLDL